LLGRSKSYKLLIRRPGKAGDVGYFPGLGIALLTVHFGWDTNLSPLAEPSRTQSAQKKIN
jgi:hypothetical protein